MHATRSSSSTAQSSSAARRAHDEVTQLSPTHNQSSAFKENECTHVTAQAGKGVAVSCTKQQVCSLCLVAGNVSTCVPRCETQAKFQTAMQICVSAACRLLFIAGEYALLMAVAMLKNSIL